MNQKTQIVFRRETSALKNSPVESFPVKADKKLSTIVGDFSLIPTNSIDHIGLIGSLQRIRIPTATKSAKKGFRVIAKW